MFVTMDSQFNLETENNVNSFYDYLLSKNYYFTKETIENYLLSLKVKPFIILTGNSGTGKTKLSQLFAQYLTRNHDLCFDNNEYLSFNLNLLNTTYSNGTMNLPKEFFNNIIPYSRFEGYCDAIVDGFDARVKIELIPRLYFKEEILNKLNNIFDKSNVKFEIKKQDINDYFNNDYYPHGPFEFTVKVGSSQTESKNWLLYKVDRNNFLNIDNQNYELNLKINNENFKTSFYIAISITVLSNEILSPHLKTLSKTNPDKEVDIELDLDSLENIDNTLNTKVTVGKSGISKGWTLNKKDIKKLYTNEMFKKEYPIFVNGIPAKGNLQLLCRLFYKDTNLQKHLEKLAEVNSKQKIPLDIILNKTSENKSNSQNNHKKTSENKLISSDNYKIIPVGANWTENRNIVGYYNLITNKYQSTPAFDLIKKSNEDKENPYFLILDEMNLSHVERYFADYLSAIESGEKIPLYGTDEELKIPSNLFTIGTVNVDETTYMFSPKVLDRANTIEFETYSAKDYMNDKFPKDYPKGNIEYIENPLDNNDISNLGINELHNILEDITVDNENFWDILSNEIFKFQEILKNAGFDFGFRVINEITRFMTVAWIYENKPENWKNWERYFDAQIKQKMLPKLHGSKRMISETLNELLDACMKDKDYNINQINKDNAKYYTSALKIKEMIEVLNKQKYVSFIN